MAPRIPDNVEDSTTAMLATQGISVFDCNFRAKERVNSGSTLSKRQSPVRSVLAASSQKVRRRSANGWKIGVLVAI
jgi:hypothetical protein